MCTEQRIDSASQRLAAGPRWHAGHFLRDGYVDRTQPETHLFRQQPFRQKHRGQQANHIYARFEVSLQWNVSFSRSWKNTPIFIQQFQQLTHCV